MFFRRETPRVTTFEDRLRQLREAGFETAPAGGGVVRVKRGVCAADVTSTPAIQHAGVVLGDEIASLVDVGFQKQWRTASGKQLAARADHLKALHAFEEDLREILGLTSLYNESLGTTNDAHLYDRVAGR